MKKLSLLIPIVLVVGIILQAVYLFDVYGPDVVSVRRNLGRSSVWRGANFNQSGKVADFVVFLNQNIPENARVVLPTLGSDRKILTTPYMQFFLAPREVINCQNVDCLQTVMGEDTYIVIVGQLPENMMENHSSLMFDENWGILLPGNYLTTEKPSTVKDFSSLEELLLHAVWPLLWLALLTLVGTILMIVALPRCQKIVQLSLGYGVGLGMFSLVVVLLGLLGISLTRWSVLLVTFLLLGASLIIFWIGRQRVREAEQTPRQAVTKPKFDFIPLIFLTLGLLVTFLGVGKGYHWIDAIQIWGAKGYGLAAESTLAAITNWGTNTLPYPLHIPVMIAAFRLLFGDILPASKMIFGGYYLALMLVGYVALVRISLARWVSGLAVWLLVTTPLLFQHGTFAGANLPLAFYLCSGVVILLPIFSGNPAWGNFLAGGLFFVFAAWVRPEGLMLALGAVGLFIIIGMFDKQVSMSWKDVLCFVSPLIVYLLFWQVVKAQVYPEPLSKNNLVADALMQISHANLHIRELVYIFSFLFQELVTPDVWGAFGIIAIIAGVFVLLFYKSVSRVAWVMIVFGGLFSGMIMGMYYLTSYDSAHDLSWWVTSGLKRMMFPGIVLLWLGMITAVHDILASFEKSKYQAVSDELS